MKLRNKKTGGLANILGEQDFFRVYTDAGGADYKSLAELNEEWEDYAPKEPLIKDEKIRKAVRAWAEANGVEEVDYWNSDYRFQDAQGGSSINFEGNPIETESRYGNDVYTIPELCGEEEE